MPITDYTQEQYEADFFDEKKREKALEHALDIRKFEIDLYWKRAAYFWAFIGATFAGYVAVQAAGATHQQDLSVILSCLGIVFSLAWFLVNRGSKLWQENWEKHVDMLENGVTGPLYKVVLTRNDPNTCGEKFRHLVTGPTPFSVSKINQIISLYISALWVCLLFYSLPKFNLEAGVNYLYLSVIGISLSACILFLWLGRTYNGGFWHKATIRTTEIK